MPLSPEGISRCGNSVCCDIPNLLQKSQTHQKYPKFTPNIPNLPRIPQISSSSACQSLSSAGRGPSLVRHGLRNSLGTKEIQRGWKEPAESSGMKEQAQLGSSQLFLPSLLISKQKYFNFFSFFFFWSSCEGEF